MKLLIVSVCVNYLDFLSFCFNKNKDSIQQHYYCIITNTKDVATQDFCSQNHINCFATDEFYHNNQPFNKGRAMNFFFKEFNTAELDFEYVLLLDSDCIFDNITDSRGNNVINSFLDLPDKNSDCLYSCGRRIYNTISDYNNKNFIQGGCHHIGFFQLFHRSKLRDGLPEFRNASVYDCEFAKRFSCHKCLGCDVDHIGPIYTNWDGRNPTSNKWY
jgi:hypothetical protein